MSSAIFLLLTPAMRSSLHFCAIAALTDEAFDSGKRLVTRAIRKEIQDYH